MYIPKYGFGHAPADMGQFSLPKAWSYDEYLTYLYLPIQMAPDGVVRIPTPLQFTNEIVRACIDDMGGYNYQYAYLTVKRGFATPGNPLNRPGWHTDGFGTTDMNYVWTDRYPTDYAIQQFENISPDDVLSMEQFEEQVDPHYIVQYPERTLLKLDPLVVHRAPADIPAPGGERSFIKVSFSGDKYNLKGNSHNYAFDYKWEMHPRDVLRNTPQGSNKDYVKD